MNLQCPNSQCGRQNPAEALRCAGCGTQLRAYNWLRLLPDYLFNQGLDLAQKGHFQQAEHSLHGALLFAAQDLESQLLLATVQALQGHSAAVAATLERVSARIGAREIADPRLARILALLNAETAARPQATAAPQVTPPLPADVAAAPTATTPVLPAAKAPVRTPSQTHKGAPAQQAKKSPKAHGKGGEKDRKHKKSGH